MSCDVPHVQRLPVFYLVYREGLSQVFEPMVLTPVAAVADRGYDVRLVAFSALGEFVRSGPRRDWKRRIEVIRAKYSGPFHRLVCPPHRLRWLWSDARLLRRWLHRCYDGGARFIAHCRGPEATHLALRARKGWPGMRVVFDMRGLAHAEYLYELGLGDPDPVPAAEAAHSRRLFEQEKRAAQEADALICVSEAMERYVRDEFKIPRERITVIPCGVQTSGTDPAEARDQVRAQLGVADRFVIAFCGSSHRWQLPERSARLVKLIQRLDPTAHYLVLTPVPDRMKRVLEHEGIVASDATIICVPHSDVARYLAAADVGLLLRERSLVNQVASPVKFAEFLASGTPVILSEGIGDYSELAARQGVGVVLPADASGSNTQELVGRFLDALRDDAVTIRRRCQSMAHEQLSASAGLKALLNVYAGLTGARQ
jgi:glycosyltransferase involved in cell wall biosynthesis